MTRAEELAKIRRECREWPQALHLINDLVADAEALAEALEFYANGSELSWVMSEADDGERAREALARYRGEK